VGYDLSGEVANGMEPVLRIGGRHATVACELPRVERLLALDETHRRLWNGLWALDLSDDVRKRVKVVGWFGAGPREDTAKEQDTHSGHLPSLLGYSVGFCDRFGGAASALAVHPQSGTLYASDTARYRVLAFEPKFRFRSTALALRNGIELTELAGWGGLSPLRFSLAGGKLPAGVSLDERTGIVGGTPKDQPGTYEFEVEVATAIETTRAKLRIELARGER
jgi:hypothetical protein